MKNENRVQVYFSPEEHAFVKSQDPGFVRRLVQDVMNRKARPLPQDEEKIIELTAKNLTKNTCKKCEAILPYFGAKCKNC